MGIVSLASFAHADEVTFYVGGYTPQSDGPMTTGVSRWALDTDTGAMKQVGAPAVTKNPSFLAWSQNHKRLYAVSEVGEPGGGVRSYAVAADGSLSESTSIASGGGAPCYLSIDQSGKHLLAANYGGSIATFALDQSNNPSRIVNAIDHTGSSVNEQRQKDPHPHSIVASPDNAVVFVPDLGQDKLVAYAFDSDSGKLTPQPAKDVATPPGSGPRHLIFHPTLPYAYASFELSNEIASYRYANGALVSIGVDPTLPESFTGQNTTAEVRIHPNGKFVYISNRGDDSIAAFRINPSDGTLKHIGTTSVQGKTPRNFNIDPSGKIMVVANQQSESLVSFHIDPDNGNLAQTGHSAATPAPTYVLF